MGFPLLSENFVATGPDGESSCPCFFKMPHPKYGRCYHSCLNFNLPKFLFVIYNRLLLFSYIFVGLPALFAFKGTIAFEIMKFSDKYRSWFVNDSVYDGEHIFSI